ncbi:hypothetical protein [Ornithobacterium rhinotracheale]|uniref:hypothetical protein n=1 Tax=Ornithobacterium rhinotracheale TaxID=28251 RepID=UPI001FF156C1|nr:hypothetical protein [Ornithobacterium rhinotracheale]MCK0205028.1 hypothetical protein [Ornithobacterium rhinotracheale]
MNLLEQAFIYLSSRGYEPRKVGLNSLRFQVDEIIYTLDLNPNDKKTLSLRVLFDLDELDESEISILRKINKLNLERRIVKFIATEDSLLIAAETLLDLTPEIGSLLNELITLLRMNILLLNFNPRA